MAEIFYREEDDEFPHFTVGGYPRQSASRQGLLPTAEQICCTVGNSTPQNSLGGMGVPTVNCRKSGAGHRSQPLDTGTQATGHRNTSHRAQEHKPLGTGTQERRSPHPRPATCNKKGNPSNSDCPFWSYTVPGGIICTSGILQISA